ncbi:MAG TPA: TraB/GumN family protein [Sedimenticola sp.]|nr:TraB/GumN family protein [Sedimenticola sp.]
MMSRLAKRILWPLVLWLGLCGTALSAAGQSVLYSFSRPGQPTHYLLGTMHSDDSRVISVLDRVRQPMDEVDQVVLEILPDAGSLVSASLAMLLPADQKLSQLLGQGLYRRVLAPMQEKGVPELLLERMKPWAVAVTLGTPELQGPAMDQVIQQRALAAGKRLVALETAQEQMALFDDLPRALQVRMLEEVLEQQDSLAMQLEHLTQAYLAGDLERLRALSLEYDAAGDQALSAWFRRVLIEERNLRMFQRLLPILEQGGTLVAVGALHLPGNEGLVKLLQNAGYSVTPLYW